MTAAGDERFDYGQEYLPHQTGRMMCREQGSAILKMNCNGYLGYAYCSRILLIDLDHGF
jgi:hypothetical protein